MDLNLTDEQQQSREAFREFVEREITPGAETCDREERMPPELIRKLADAGYLGGIITREFGGREMDATTFGLLNEELNRGSTSPRSLLTVHSMVARAIQRWGGDEQKKRWLPVLAAGKRVAAFALTEPEHGCDAGGIETTLEISGDTIVLNGRKKWITCGQIADLFLVFGKSDDKLCAVLVEKDTPGLGVKPISGLLGDRAAMLAELEFDNCEVPAENLLGRVGFGLTPVAFTALNIGRFTIAWGCVGMAQACFDSCIQYTKNRKQFGVPIKDHQLVKRSITEMMVDIEAARLLCYQSGISGDLDDRRTFENMLIAKYFASNMAVRVTGQAVHLHGANGYTREFVVERFFRDAKIMQMIEGSNEMLQLMISRYGYK